MTTWKRILTLMLAVLMTLSVLAACGGSNAETAQTPAETNPVTEPTQPGEEGKTLKILTLGHSLAVDCGHMLNRVAAAEGYDSLKIATLYYSGCPLASHVQYLTNNSPEYSLYVSESKTPDLVPEIFKSVTMEYALRYDYWDIVIMQGGVFEIAASKKYTDGNIKTIQKYVLENCLNPNVKFAWHMTWVPPTDNSLRDQYPYPENNTYYSGYIPYSDDRSTMYQCVVDCVQKHIVTDETFQFVIPTATAMENALSSYLEETDIHRDYVHASDLTRVMNSYVWYCKLLGIEKVEEIKMDTIPVAFFKSTKGVEDRVLTDAEKAIILEAINNALKNPYEMTPSQYTTAP